MEVVSAAVMCSPGLLTNITSSSPAFISAPINMTELQKLKIKITSDIDIKSGNLCSTLKN